MLYWSLLFTKYYSGDQINKNEMIGACSTYWGQGDRRRTYRVLVGKPEGKNNFQDRGVNGKIMLRWTFWMVVPCIWFEIRVNYQLYANICLF